MSFKTMLGKPTGDVTHSLSVLYTVIGQMESGCCCWLTGTLISIIGSTCVYLLFQNGCCEYSLQGAVKNSHARCFAYLDTCLFTIWLTWIAYIPCRVIFMCVLNIKIHVPQWLHIQFNQSVYLCQEMLCEMIKMVKTFFFKLVKKQQQQVY